ncbi:hypothetical protein MTO96_040902, partial [Rhipicephalus appendiculatus]
EEEDDTWGLEPSTARASGDSTVDKALSTATDAFFDRSWSLCLLVPKRKKAEKERQRFLEMERDELPDSSKRRRNSSSQNNVLTGELGTNESASRPFVSCETYGRPFSFGGRTSIASTSTRKRLGRRKRTSAPTAHTSPRTS